MREIFDLYIPHTFVDIIDVLIVAAIFYLLFSMLRETRSAVALRGLISLLLFSFVVFFLAELARLNAVTLIFRSFWIVILLLLLILYGASLSDWYSWKTQRKALIRARIC